MPAVWLSSEPDALAGAREDGGMHELNGTYTCALCGVRVEMAEDQLLTVIVGASGKPNVRVLLVDGREVHRCNVPSRRTVPRRP
jgi:hypothetical protein